MVAESVKKSVKEIFETHVKTLKKCSHEDTDSNSDSENEHYHMRDVGLDLKEVNVSEPLHCLICTDLPKNIKKLTN